MIRRARSSGLLPRPMLQALAARGVTRLMVEGGAGLAAALLQAGLVDRLAWFHAPGVMGAEGWPSTGPLALQRLAAMPRFRLARTRVVGQDVVSEFERE